MATSAWGKEKDFDTSRGRNAKTPSEIPVKGWKDTLLRVKKEIGNDRLSLVSAAMSYYALLALVPAMTSIVLIYAWISDPVEISNHISKAGRFIPNEFQEILRGQLTSLSSKAQSTLGFSAIGALLFSLWSSSKANKAIMEALNMVNEEKESRGFFKINLTAMGLTLLGVVLSVVAILVVIGMPALMSQFEFGDTIEAVVAGLSWVFMLALFTFYLAIIYRFAPCRNKPKWKWVSWGAVAAAVLWALASLLFSWYAAKFGDFNKTYGSLGAVVVLMTWFYISSFVILLGAEINAESEHQTKRDTTTGPEKPMGFRKAEMADTVGESMLH